MKTFNEEHIINGCIEQDRLSQKELYNHFSSKMYGVCLRYSNDRETAQDILQDGFIKVFKNITAYKGAGSFEGWIRRIMVNTAIEYFRKKQHLAVIEEVENSIPNKGEETPLDKMGYEEILELVQQLSPGYRTVFNLYVLEGFPHQEIAEKLGISEGTSKSQLARARQILQEKIKKKQTFLQKDNLDTTI